MPDMAAFTANVERMINAALTIGRTSQRTPPSSRSGSNGSQRGGSQRTGRSIPSPKFKGCWCCGSEDHRRENCPEFIKIKKANGGKVPKGYEGAYEKSLKKSGQSQKVIAPISVTPLSVPVEYNETTIPVWPLLSAPSKAARRPPKLQVTPTSNKFDVFMNDNDEDDDDDEESLMKTLNAMTSSVSLASDKL